MSIIDNIRDWLDQDKSVRMVAGDIQLTSELLLLVRMMLADGELKPAELDNFKRICNRAFGIPHEDVPDVINYLKEFGYETTAQDAAKMFQSLDIERKRALLVHMFSIAKSDNDLDENEIELIRRTAGILGLTAEDILAAGRGGS